MSRSRKHTPKGGITTSASEKADKRHANRRLRLATSQALHREAEVMPELREVSDVWGFAKDGKAWHGEHDDMRK